MKTFYLRIVRNKLDFSIKQDGADLFDAVARAKRTYPGSQVFVLDPEKEKPLDERVKKWS